MGKEQLHVRDFTVRTDFDSAYHNEPVGFLPYSFSILILPIFHHDMSLNALKPCDLI
ncbi:hypothetical protein ACN08S_04465 [Photobacterium leiognathi subsp. mandapamensis]